MRMKKHFLLLLWMTLLPLAGLAQNVQVGITLKNVEKYYGDADPAPQYVIDNQGSYTEEQIAAINTILENAQLVRVNTGEDVGFYEYDINFEQGDGYHILAGGYAKLQIKPLSIAQGWEATLEEGEFTFKGEEWEPAVTAVTKTGSDPAVTLTANDYDVTYAENVNVAYDGENVIENAQVIVTGKGNYTGSFTKKFKITPLATEFTVNLTGDFENGTVVYKNDVYVPTYEVLSDVSQTPLTITTDFTAAWTPELHGTTLKNVGEYTLTITGAGNYAGSTGTATLTIDPYDINTSGETWWVDAAAETYTYTGQAITPTPRVHLLGNTTGGFNASTDYFNYSYSDNNTNVTTGEDVVTVTVTPKNTYWAYQNFTGSRTATFKIVPASVEGGLPDGLVINDFADENYTSKQITPEITTTNGAVTFGEASLEEGTDYTVEYGANINAGENAGSVIYTFIKNFTGSYTKNFNITPATLTIKANNVNVNYGTAVPAFSVTYDGFVGEESEETEGIFGESELTFGVKATDNPEAEDVATYATVGTYYIWPAGLDAANYRITFASGVLNVGVAELRIVVNDVEKNYGDADELTYKVLDANDQEVQVGEWQTAPVIGRAEGEDAETVGKYAITVTNEPAHANYGFTYVPGTLTINPRPVAIKTSNQEKDYGVAISQNVGYWSTNPYPTPGDYFAPEEGKADLGVILYVVDGEGNEVTDYQTLAVGGEYTIMAKLAEGSNYALITEGEVPTCVWGTLKVKDVTEETVLALDDSMDDNLTKINAFNGQNVNVSIKFSQRNAQDFFGYGQWKAENWTTLVLPFDISVADLSKAFGYAIVNVINPERTVVSGTSSEFYGKLTMKGGNGGEENGVLAANKPILIKLADNIADLNEGSFVVDFGQQTIVAPEGMTVDAGEGARFVGTYEAMAIGKDTKYNDGSIWFMLGDYSKWAFINAGSTSASWTIVPFAAYIDMSAIPEEARNMTFFFEEIDGSTTAIRSIDVDDINQKLSPEGWYNLNGVKLQGAPTQKGVYIKDGKKFVIK